MGVVDYCKHYRYREGIGALEDLYELLRFSRDFGSAPSNDAFIDDPEKARKIFLKFRDDHLHMKNSEFRKFFLYYPCKCEEYSPLNDRRAFSKLIERCCLIESDSKKQRFLLKILRFINYNFMKFEYEAQESAMIILAMLDNYRKSGMETAPVRRFLTSYNSCAFYNSLRFIPYINCGLNYGLEMSALTDGLKNLEISLIDNEYNILNCFFQDFFTNIPEIFKGNYDFEKCYAFFFIGKDPNDGSRFPSIDSRLMESVVNEMDNHRFNRQFIASAIKFVSHHYGDPRVMSSRANWSRINSDIINRYRTHLMRTDITVFFQYISNSISTRVDAYMWKERSEYWQWFLDRGLIVDAWVILTPHVVSRFKSDLQRQGLNYYGVGQVKSNNGSYILFRLTGGRVIAECAHNGPTRIYKMGEGNSPKFYITPEEGFYDETMITIGDPERMPHHAGVWRMRLDEKIEHCTGIPLRIMRRGY